MANAWSNPRQKPGRGAGPPGSRSGSWWRPALLVGIVGLASVLAFVTLNDSPDLRPPSDGPEDAVSRQPTGVSKAPGGSSVTRPVAAAGSTRESLVPAPPSRAERQAASTARPSRFGRRSRELIGKLQAKHSDGVITEAEANEINQVLRELAEQGAAAVPAIGDFLRRMEDVDFDKVSGGDLVAHGSLRLGLLDALGQIGGKEAIEVSLEQLRETMDPVELAVLARNLEAEAFGVYGEEILNAARRALLRAGQVPPEERVDVSPLFELLQAYGGVEVAVDLEQVMPTWSQYSLMALAGLPDGEGVPSLVAMARDPRVPVAHKTGLPFQMLAQTSVEHPEAGDALIDLARSGQIPDRAWGSVGAALQGMHLKFPLELFEGMSSEGNGAAVSGTDAPRLGAYETKDLDVSYDLRLVSASWSDEQINRQLALIDGLLSATASPAAMKALREARSSLLARNRY